MPQIKNISIIGGSGQQGTPILKALLLSKHFTITAITRSSSPSTSPPGITVTRGDYSSSFLESALKNQDALVIILGVAAPKDLQSRIITAAASACVPWVLPCEFGPDGASREMMDGLPVLAAKKGVRDEIEAAGDSGWLGIVCGLWFDVNLKNAFFGLNIKERTVRLYDEGTTVLSTSTLDQVGCGVVKLLSLPSEKLLKYRNSFVYINSFHVSQLDIFHSLLKATSTEEAAWKVTKVPVHNAITEGRNALAAGDYKGGLDMFVGMMFKEGAGGDFRPKSNNGDLGLVEENLDEVVAQVVKKVEAA
ncbi:hypothetical protein LOCC1_G008568 [Lachnellula occidentalis]|uniref:NmrA-like domain-containing protein n=1 Tax=Lachnellula occidentalis TaxID=215460 RepID=A0A8H8RLJ2_9HELO|nr:hypothetical protein LOCC1_G008568 [Lachnellula occidentalis]